MRMPEKINLWEDVGNECLRKALHILKISSDGDGMAPELVKEWVDIAISIDDLSLRWEQKIQTGNSPFQRLQGKK